MQAMLILAHKNVDQVLQLASKLNRRFEVYIHFDTKCPVSEKEKSFMDDNGIKHISEVDVNWGSWSIGEAAYRLMKLALKNPEILMSYMKFLKITIESICVISRLKTELSHMNG